MRDNYNFSNAIRNPFPRKSKGKYNVTIYWDPNEDNEDDIVDSDYSQPDESMVAEASESISQYQRQGSS